MPVRRFFNFSGIYQKFIVPDSTHSFLVDISREQKGGSNIHVLNRGLGGRVQAEMTVTPGQVMYFYVGVRVRIR